MKLWPYAVAAAAAVIALFAAAYFFRSHPGETRSGALSEVAWQRMAEPGQLSKPHAFLEHNCAACHTAVKGAETQNCIVCHANNQPLLQRQPTAFHANVQSCVECHREHQGASARPTMMDHAALTRIGSRTIGGTGVARRADAALNCVACHGNQDRHQKLFGADCAACHNTNAWTIAEFKHPSPASTSCAQCHQAPPSHYMEHFQMVSMTVAGQAHAQVSQCFLCHQTTSWNDIKGVGWYKHH